MANSWFRMHHELLNDPKVQTLSDAEFKMYINLLCLASQRGENGDLGNVSDICFALRETKEAFHERFIALHQRGLIVTNETDGETFHIPKWRKRQYISDTSTDRVRKHRKRSKTVTVTPPDTDTDTEQNREEYSQSAPDEWPEMIWGELYPHPANRGTRKKTLLALGRIPKRDRKAVVDGIRNYRDYLEIATWQKPKMLSTWLNAESWKTPIDLDQARRENNGQARLQAPTREDKQRSILAGIAKASGVDLEADCGGGGENIVTLPVGQSVYG